MPIFQEKDKRNRITNILRTTSSQKNPLGLQCTVFPNHDFRLKDFGTGLSKPGVQPLFFPLDNFQKFFNCFSNCSSLSLKGGFRIVKPRCLPTILRAKLRTSFCSEREAKFGDLALYFWQLHFIPESNLSTQCSEAAITCPTKVPHGNIWRAQSGRIIQSVKPSRDLLWHFVLGRCVDNLPFISVSFAVFPTSSIAPPSVASAPSSGGSGIVGAIGSSCSLSLLSLVPATTVSQLFLACRGVQTGFLVLATQGLIKICFPFLRHKTMPASVESLGGAPLYVQIPPLLFGGWASDRTLHPCFVRVSWNCEGIQLAGTPLAAQRFTRSSCEEFWSWTPMIPKQLLVPLRKAIPASTSRASFRAWARYWALVMFCSLANHLTGCLAGLSPTVAQKACLAPDFLTILTAFSSEVLMKPMTTSSFWI